MHPQESVDGAEGLEFGAGGDKGGDGCLSRVFSPVEQTGWYGTHVYKHTLIHKR